VKFFACELIHFGFAHRFTSKHDSPFGRELFLLPIRPVERGCSIDISHLKTHHLKPITTKMSILGYPT
jgi:hypothetical protein